MGAKKRLRAERIKEERKNQYFAKLRNSPTSPRKMRLVADMIRGKEVNQALDMLRFHPKAAAKDLEKLLMSAIANWQVKNEGERFEDHQLYVKQIHVDPGRMLKRVKPAAQGRAHLIRRRSNHVTLVLDNLNQEDEEI